MTLYFLNNEFRMKESKRHSTLKKMGIKISFFIKKNYFFKT